MKYLFPRFLFVLAIFGTIVGCEETDQLLSVDSDQVAEEFFTIRSIDDAISGSLMQEALDKLPKEELASIDGTIYAPAEEVISLLRNDLRQNGVLQINKIGVPYWGNGLKEAMSDRNNYYYPLIHLGSVHGVLVVGKSTIIHSVKAIPESYITASDRRSFLTAAFAHFQTAMTGRTTVSPQLLLAESDLLDYNLSQTTTDTDGILRCDTEPGYFVAGDCFIYVFVNSDCSETWYVDCEEEIGGSPSQGGEHNGCNCGVEPFEDGGDLGGNVNPPVGDPPNSNPLGEGLATASDIEGLLMCNPGDFNSNIGPSLAEEFNPPCSNFEVWLDADGIIELRCPNNSSYAFDTGLSILELTCQGL